MVVFGCFLLQAIPMVFMSSSWSFYQMPISEAMNTNYVAFSTSSLLATVATMAFSLLFATKIASGKTRLYMLIGGVVAGVSFAAMGFATQKWLIYVLNTITNFALAAVLFIPANILISNWFIDRKGLATSICYAGSPVGGVFLTKIISGMITNQGWQYSLMVSGVVTVIVAIIAFLLIRKTPEEMNLEPYRINKNNSEVEAAGAADAAPQWEGLSKAEAVKTKAFIFMVIFALCGGLLASGIISQIPTYLSELGMDYSGVFTVFSFVSIFSALSIGPLYDKIGLSKGIAFCTVLTALCCVSLILTKSVPVLAYVAVILWAFGSTSGSLAPPLMVGQLFGLKDMGGIFGLVNFFFYGGCMAGAIISSGVRVATGSYTMAWVVFICVTALQLITILVSMKSGSKLRNSSVGK